MYLVDFQNQTVVLCLKTGFSFTGGPVVSTSPSKAGGEGFVPGWGGEIPTCLVVKNPNRTEAILS